MKENKMYEEIVSGIHINCVTPSNIQYICSLFQNKYHSHSQALFKERFHSKIWEKEQVGSVLYVAVFDISKGKVIPHEKANHVVISCSKIVISK